MVRKANGDATTLGGKFHEGADGADEATPRVRYSNFSSGNSTDSEQSGHG